MPKKSLRRAMLERRAALSDEEWSASSSTAQQLLTGLPLFESAGVVALYSPVNREVDTSKIMVRALEAGKRVLYPSVVGTALLFREIGRESDLIPKAFGILEPAETCPEVAAMAADCIVVPGVAFDRHGRRIGYGKGYYDRALHRLEGSGRLVGICFDFQLVEEIFGEPHDVMLDLIITERRIIPVRKP